MPDQLRDALRAHEDGATLEQVWKMLPAAELSPSASTLAESREALWASIAAETVASTPVISLTAHRERDRHRGRASRVVMLLAAAAMLVVSITWPFREVTSSTAAGQTAELTLGDGSIVTLNGATDLRYPRRFRPVWLGGGTRHVELRGVAFFSVAKDPARPFIVETGQARVHVVGTRFNVASRSNDRSATTDVAVEEGVVQVRARDANNAGEPTAVTLRANESVRMSRRTANAPLRTSTGDVARETAWIRGGFSAVDLPFTAIVAELESQYGVEIALTGTAASSEAMTVYYPTRRAIDAILLDLCTARGLVLRRSSRGFEISPAP